MSALASPWASINLPSSAVRPKAEKTSVGLRWLVWQRVTSAESCCHQLLRRRMVPCCFIQGILASLWLFWLCCLLRFFQPFGIPQPCPETTQQQVRCSDFNVARFGLGPDQPSLRPALRLALPAAGYGLLFHHINSYQVPLHAGWTEAGLSGKVTKTSCDRQPVEPSVQDVVPCCHGSQATVESVNHCVPGSMLGRKGIAPVVSTRAGSH